MSEVFVQVYFKDCPLKRGARTKHYSGQAKISRTGVDYVDQKFCVRDLLPEATFFDEDWTAIEHFLAKRSYSEIMDLLNRADEAAGDLNNG